MNTNNYTIEQGPAIFTSKFGLRSVFRDINTGSFSQAPHSLIASERERSLSPQGITSFLSFRYPIGKHTMFGGVERVPFGCDLVAGDPVRKWVPRFSTEKGTSIDDASEAATSLIRNAIERDGENKEIGVVLSGGLDSSLLVALAREIWPEKIIRTYTAGFQEEDEFEFARIVARLFNTEHYERLITKEDYIGESSIMDKLIEHKGEPLHPNELSLALLESKAAADGCQVILCGEGADDIFGGYGKNFRMYLDFPGGTANDFCGYYLGNYRYFGLQEQRNFIKDEYLVDDLTLMTQVFDFKDFPADIENAALFITQMIHTPGLITRGVSAVTFNGLKPCFPFIDDELVEYVNNLPFSLKVRWLNEDSKAAASEKPYYEVSEKYDTPKFLLKKMAEKYLPKEIIYRKKYGFPVPLNQWLKDLKDWDFSSRFFKVNELSGISGWKKFMLINLDTFIKTFVG